VIDRLVSKVVKLSFEIDSSSFPKGVIYANVVDERRGPYNWRKSESLKSAVVNVLGGSVFGALLNYKREGYPGMITMWEVMEELGMMFEDVEKKVEFQFEGFFQGWDDDLKRLWWHWRRPVEESEEVMRDLSAELGWDVWMDGVLRYKDGNWIQRVFTELDWDAESVYKKLEAWQKAHLKMALLSRRWWLVDGFLW
jgi:hypothetical protein